MQNSQKTDDITSFTSIRRLQSQSRFNLDKPAEHNSIGEICSIAKRLLSLATNSNPLLEYDEDPQSTAMAEECCDAVWESLSNFAEILSCTPAASLEDIIGKISIWRSLAPEESEADYAPDEKLARAIMKDLEELLQSQKQKS